MKETILIVEDDRDLRELLEEIFEDEGFAVESAANGKRALDVLSDEGRTIDLVVTDMQMPEIKGERVLQKVRERRGETPVIVITAFGTVEQAVEMVRSGAFEYLTKPIQMNDLIDVSRRALEASRARRTRRRGDDPLLRCTRVGQAAEGFDDASARPGS